MNRYRGWKTRLAAAGFCLAVGSGGGGGPAHAGEPGAKPDLWLVTVGSWATVEPDFEGSRRYGLGWKPMFSLRKSDSRDWLALPNDGMDFELIETDSFRAGPVLTWRWLAGDKSKPVAAGFRRLGPIDLSIEGGVFAEYWPTTWIRLRTEVRDAALGGKGVVADLTSDLVWRPTPRLVVAWGPRLSVADSDYMRAHYGADTQSVPPGQPVQQAGAGLRAIGTGAFTKYAWSEQWSTSAFLEYQHLADAAAGSPVVHDHGTRDQLSGGIGLSYTFGIGR